MLPTKFEKKLKTVLNPVARTKWRLREQSVWGREPRHPPGWEEGTRPPRLPRLLRDYVFPETESQG